jgi:ferric-dicitrate binding protein FerR (iron transport regulator)
MQDNDYIVLLHKELTGEINPAEKAALSDWIAQSADHALLADDLRAAWEKSEGYEKKFKTDLDAAFGQVQARIRAESPMRVVSFRQQLLRVAAVVTILIAGIWGFQHFAGVGNTPDQVIVSSEGDIKEVALPDGTHVWLRKGAQIEYPAAFTGKGRPVQLRGEAYFEVAHDASKVFHITLEDGKSGVEVLGTAFNIRQGPQETAVTVRNGKVRFYPDDNSKSVVLTAGKKAVLNKIKRQIVTENVLTFNELSWQTGGLEFIRTPMRKVISDLETYYGVQITLTNTDLQDCTHTAPLTNQPLEKVLESLSLTYQMQVKKTGPKAYLLTGGSCQ